MFKLVLINIWILLLSVLFLLLNGTMESYIHFNTDQSLFMASDFLEYYFYVLAILAVLFTIFIVVVKRTKLEDKHAKIVYGEFRLFGFSWTLFAINLIVSYFVLDVVYPWGIVWYIVQLGLLGFALYKLIKGNYKDFLTITE